MKDTKKGKRVIDYTKYPLRRCRWINECNICHLSITMEQEYFDGGYGRRAHKGCINIEELK